MHLPDFYDPQRVDRLDRPDVASAVAVGAAVGLPPAAEDRARVLLLLVDCQVDFIHPQGTLSVPGAVEDTRRTIEWLYRQLDRVTTVAASLDSHIPLQIFYPTWWLGADGAQPAPYTVITADDAAAGRWRPVYQPQWSLEYLTRLEQQAKKSLMIWPYHTMIGSVGHNLMPALYEAIMLHSAARQAQPRFFIKGMIPQTEHYSIIEPEVKPPDEPRAQPNGELLDLIPAHDRVYIAGQAKSHCVLETIASLVRHFGAGSDVVRRFHVLTDCMSSVAHPQIDFETLAAQAFAEFAAAGMHLEEAEG
jgi:nicotinamidase-related amidase